MFVKFTVYILYSKNLGRFYCGQTSNLDDRLCRHNEGRSKYTAKGKPWHLIYTKDFNNRSDAVKLERSIKKRGIKRYLDDNNCKYNF